MQKFLFALVLSPAFASGATVQSYDFGLSPNDYLAKDRSGYHDNVFNDYRKIELGIDLSSGVDCGRLDLKGTLKSTVDKVLDPSLFGNALENIAAGAPLLATCYFSPTWCSLAKHFRMNAQAMSELRFNQCAVMDKYVDSRVEDYYAERQSCLHKELERTGGNHEEAVSRCGGGGLYQRDIANWAGDKFGGKVQTNKLIESSAKWAGFDGPDAKRAVDLVKSFVGDTTVSSGKISVEYGPRQVALSPNEHLAGLKKQTIERLCSGILGRLKGRMPNEVFRAVSEQDLKGITDSGRTYIDQQTVYYLMRLPSERRNLYCERLASSVAISRFSEDMNRSLQILTEVGQNPNLPDNRKREIQDKRRALKEAIEVTVALEREQTAPINEITSQINQEGSDVEVSSTTRAMESDRNTLDYGLVKSKFYDCADSANCDQKGGQR